MRKGDKVNAAMHYTKTHRRVVVQLHIFLLSSSDVSGRPQSATALASEKRKSWLIEQNACCRVQLKYDGTRWHRERKWRRNWQMEWVASNLHATSEHGVSSITTVDAHTSAARSRMNWRPRRFIWTRPFRRKKKSVFCLCTITFQTQSTSQRVLIPSWNTSHYFVQLWHYVMAFSVSKTKIVRLGPSTLILKYQIICAEILRKCSTGIPQI